MNPGGSAGPPYSTAETRAGATACAQRRCCAPSCRCAVPPGRWIRFACCQRAATPAGLLPSPSPFVVRFRRTRVRSGHAVERAGRRHRSRSGNTPSVLALLWVCAGTPGVGVVVLCRPSSNWRKPAGRAARIAGMPTPVFRRFRQDGPATADPQRGDDIIMGSARTDRQPDTISWSSDSPGTRLLQRVWRDRRIAIGVAVVVPGVVTLLCALAMPRAR